jgi:hypothetical protein
MTDKQCGLIENGFGYQIAGIVGYFVSPTQMFFVS